MILLLSRGPRRCVSGPEMLCGVGTEGTPPLGPLHEILGAERSSSTKARAPQKTTIARGECIRLARRAKRDVVRGPFADAVDVREPSYGFFDRALPLEDARV